ncbi:nucleotide disphospho-sugar-binding domain-containing protein [Streptomyces sp. NPDC048417]|uniref:nucleotide disphospho-sugar-binding domain-containing protein n=1 Tax=Streptomyces sp. NPDC048417 TaxID=3155387 RepID=UPI00341D50ED
MRILFTTYAARPHLYPLVPTAWAAVAAGHDVRVASTPELADAVAGTGLPSVTVGRDIDSDFWYRRGIFVPRSGYPGEPEEAAWIRVTDQLALKQFSIAEAMVDGLVEYARSWRPDVIVHDPVTFAGPVAAQVLGVPSVGHLYGMARHLRLEIVDRTGTEPHPDFLQLFARSKVAPRVDPTLWIDPCPPSLRWPGGREIDRCHIRYIPYNGPGVEPDWLREPPARPRVCVTWGTSQQKKMGPGVIELFGRIARAVAALDVEVLLTTGAVGQEQLHHLGPLPANVRQVGWIPLGMLADGCAAVVHTGGTGVMTTAAARGLPQLGITKIPEGRFNVERLAAVGAGLQIDQDAADDEAVRKAVDVLLTDAAPRSAATALRADIEAQPLPATAVAAIEGLVR